MTAITIIAAVAGIILLANAARILREYERVVVFRLGRCIGVAGPGLVLLIPFVDRVVKVDLRIHTEDVPPQDVITRDNVSVTVNAVVYRRIVDARLAVLGVEDVAFATQQVAQTTLRSALGRADLNTLLTEQDRLATDLQAMITTQVRAWGVEILAVEIKDILLPEDMKRALARRAEAERERRAKVIHAGGELMAAERLADSAAMLAREPAAIHLRYLQSLVEVSAENNSTVVVPVPIDALAALFRPRDAGSAPPSERTEREP